MNMPANFKVDTWYKGFVFFGGTLVITGLFYPVQVFDNQNVTLFGLGFFIFGLSIWGNQRAFIFDVNGKEIKVKKSLKTHLKPVVRFTLSCIGLYLIFYSVYEIIKRYIA